jgi:spore maturation protein SpmA
VEVARMIMSEEIDDANPKKAELFNIEITLITMNNLKLSLFPFDVINIRKMAVYENRRWLH